MNGIDRHQNQLGLISYLSTKVPKERLGRTAVMKLLYFMQALKQVPLDYDFRLYNYGPFDSEVLVDVKRAQRENAVSVELEQFPSGYGYQISSGELAEEFLEKSEQFLDKYRRDIDWVINKFGGLLASELELLSTIDFVSTERQYQLDADRDRLLEEVRAIKPHFDRAKIAKEIERLREIRGS